MFGFIERVVIPTLVIFVLLGGISGVLLGAALVWRSEAALRFVSRMNRWVSTRQALRALEALHAAQGPSPRLRRWLGGFLVFGGAFSVVFLLARLDLHRSRFAPNVNVEHWLVSGVLLATMKWVLVVGSAFAFAVGVLMLFFPARLAPLESRMDHWYASRGLSDSGDTTIKPRMITPLEPRVEANPRTAGTVIGAASLLIALAMVVLIFAKLR